MGPVLSRKKILIGKSAQNSPTSTDILARIPCVICLYIMLLKVVSHYDLNVLSMSVMGFQKSLDRGWVGWVSSIQFFCFLGFF